MIGVITSLRDWQTSRNVATQIDLLSTGKQAHAKEQGILPDYTAWKLLYLEAVLANSTIVIYLTGAAAVC